MTFPSSLGFSTRAVHSGQEPDPVTGAVIPPITLSATFKIDADTSKAADRYVYGRINNPSRQNFETAIASLEGAEYAAAFSSGVGTVTAILQTLAPGSHVVCVDCVYGGTFVLLNEIAVESNIETDFINLDNPVALKSALKENTKLVWIESPTNPTVRLVDIQAVANIAHAHGAKLVVDNTFMSPYFQNPLSLGADIVMHSVTKYINGHSDVTMGVAVTNDEQIGKRLHFLQNVTGAVPSPFDCYLARRGLITLEVRMRKHEENALAVAQFLEENPNVDQVLYPGLPSHPQHELAKRQQKGFGGMLSVRMKGELSNVQRLVSELKVVTLAVSLGGAESLVELPATMTHLEMDQDTKEKLGITDTLIRVSIGIETLQDLLDDFAQAIEKAYL
ncbi:hypothetical protein VTP01DRAFT_10931 [Rhizomucor pusillus]|uniref:uncharacterized protein n=1 Tax=Rhizomucor pusillus TaxID=4840 RepID=UPI0037437FC1